MPKSPGQDTHGGIADTQKKINFWKTRNTTRNQPVAASGTIQNQSLPGTSAIRNGKLNVSHDSSSTQRQSSFNAKTQSLLIRSTPSFAKSSRTIVASLRLCVKSYSSVV